jgi:hypothetical protein
LVPEGLNDKALEDSSLCGLFQHRTQSKVFPNIMPPLVASHPQQQPHGGISVPHQQLRQVPSQPLRRATYVHVSDLISAYNIDHIKLDEELDRVKSERDGVENKQAKRNNLSGGSESSRHGSTLHNSSSHGSHSTLGGIPTELEARDHQKRLQPPRGGYNMVVYVYCCIHSFSYDPI